MGKKEAGGQCESKETSQAFIIAVWGRDGGLDWGWDERKIMENWQDMLI